MADSRHSGRRRGGYRRGREAVSPPSPLTRAPRTDLAARIEDLDGDVLAVMDVIAGDLRGAVDDASSLDNMRLLMTESHLLQAMIGTHRSIRHLIGPEEAALDLSVDALTLTRVQLERCFLTLLIVDGPGRWYKRYRKNAWKVFAEKFFRDRCCIGHMDEYKDYFGPNGPGIAMLREFSREMGVWEDEFQTLRIQATGDEPDPRWPPRYIADMPTPGKAVAELKDPQRKALAVTLYPFYASLSHFSHGGLGGVMQAAILRGPAGTPDSDDADDSVDAAAKKQFYRANVLETVLPHSYVSMLLVATLFAIALDDGDRHGRLLRAAWQPYHSDGSLLGIAVWDQWADKALEGAEEGAK